MLCAAFVADDHGQCGEAIDADAEVCFCQQAPIAGAITTSGEMTGSVPAELRSGKRVGRHGQCGLGLAQGRQWVLSTLSTLVYASVDSPVDIQTDCAAMGLSLLSTLSTLK